MKHVSALLLALFISTPCLAAEPYRMVDVPDAPKGGYKEYGNRIYIDRGSLEALHDMSPKQRKKTIDRWAAGRTVMPQQARENTQGSAPAVSSPYHDTGPKPVEAKPYRVEPIKPKGPQATDRPRLADYPRGVASVSAFDATRVNRKLLEVQNPDQYVRLNAFDRALQGNVYERMDNKQVDSTIRPFSDNNRRSAISRYSRVKVNAGRQNEFSDLVEVPNVRIDKSQVQYQAVDQYKDPNTVNKLGYIRQGVAAKKRVSTKAFDVPITSADVRYGDKAFSGEREIDAFRPQITRDRTPRAMLGNVTSYQYRDKDNDKKLERYEILDPETYTPVVSPNVGVKKLDQVDRLQVIPVRKAPRLRDRDGNILENPNAYLPEEVTSGVGNVYPQDETANQTIYGAPSVPVFTGSTTN
ncbi:hypothetical protein GC177_08625 [bacterium]|nr:hypothetical protein [bacterium]